MLFMTISIRSSKNRPDVVRAELRRALPGYLVSEADAAAPPTAKKLLPK